MKSILKYFYVASLALYTAIGYTALASSPSAIAQDSSIQDGSGVTDSPAATYDPHQGFCISVITGFPNDSHVSRYQFFKLTNDLAEDASPEFISTLKTYESEPITADTPVLDVIENIANPVLRQAAPQIIIGSMNHLIDFNQKCKSHVDGQINSLSAFDPKLTEADPIIAEDALYLRQILLDSLSRAGADQNPTHIAIIATYNDGLIRTRDHIEFTSYAEDVSNVEALFMQDLDGRLARSNDIINSEIDREALGDAVLLSDDLNDSLRRKQKENDIRTLLQILSRY